MYLKLPINNLSIDLDRTYSAAQLSEIKQKVYHVFRKFTEGTSKEFQFIDKLRFIDMLVQQSNKDYPLYTEHILTSICQEESYFSEYEIGEKLQPFDYEDIEDIEDWWSTHFSVREIATEFRRRGNSPLYNPDTLNEKSQKNFFLIVSWIINYEEGRRK